MLTKTQSVYTLLRTFPRLAAQHELILKVVIPRFKHKQYQGVKGIRGRKPAFYTQTNDAEEKEEEEISHAGEKSLKLDERAYDEVVANTMHVERETCRPQNVIIIQPYVKWGTKRNMAKAPDDQLQEAEALIRSLPNWQVAIKLKVPLESLERKMLFGSGKLVELKQIIGEMCQRNLGEQKPLTLLFVSKGTLTFLQKRLLEQEFNLPVMDRYSVVIQILRLHATSAEARLQVAMAEIPYIWAQAKEHNVSVTRRQGYSLTDTQREVLKTRERNLRQELTRIRSHRKLLRNKRKQKNYPVIAVVGYTNAGKTSLIKALTQEQEMQPKDQLFATLDVTAHAGVLPCKLEVLYMDTVGFMSDLPTGLFECFVATLEDVMLADVIVHVQDVAHKCWQAQSQHVNATLASLSQSLATSDDIKAKSSLLLPPIINVGNKMDLLAQGMEENESFENIWLISSKQNTGLRDLLEEIERQVLISTNRLTTTMRVRSGGEEMAWLYKNAAVLDIEIDSQCTENLIMHIVITDVALQQFKHRFAT